MLRNLNLFHRKGKRMKTKPAIYIGVIIVLTTLVFIQAFSNNHAPVTIITTVPVTGTPISTGAMPTKESIPISNDCIQPLEKFAFKTSTDQSIKTPGTDFNYLPPYPWQVESTISSLLPTNISFSYVYAIRNIEERKELWVSNYTSDLFDKTSSQFNVYNTNTNEWTNIAKEIDDTETLASGLFITSDNAIWSTHYWDEKSSNKHPLLSKYNEATKKFEFVTKTQEIPSFRQELNADPYRYPYRSLVILDKKDVFWVFVHADGIYSYNTITGEIKRHANLPNMEVTDAKLAPDGSIYFVNRATLQTGSLLLEVFNFMPETDLVEQVSTYEMEKTQVRPFSNILVDRQNRLWLSDLGWMEPDGTWYAIIRSPVFLTNVAWTGGSSRWATPNILLESSDGRLWFRSDNGMAWLDPQKGEWCWFTTYQSNIVEDSDNNLWMIADGKLYKYALGK